MDSSQTLSISPRSKLTEACLTRRFRLVDDVLNKRATIADFCESEGVSVSGYHYWRKKYLLSRTPAFLPIHLAEPLSKTGGIDSNGEPAASQDCFAELHFPSGVQVRIMEPVAPEYLESLISKS